MAQIGSASGISTEEFAVSKSLPNNLLARKIDSFGGPVPGVASYLSPPFRVSDAQSQLEKFREKLAEVFNGFQSVEGSTDLDVSDCKNKSLQEHVEQRLKQILQSDGNTGPETAEERRADGAIEAAFASESGHDGTVEGVSQRAQQDKVRTTKLPRSLHAKFPPSLLHHLDEAEAEWQQRWKDSSQSLATLRRVKCPRLERHAVGDRAPEACSGSAEPPAPDGGPAEGGPTGAQDPRAAGGPAGSPPAKTSEADPAEVVLSVAVFHPYVGARRTHEFLVLGSTPLTKLRDCLYCLNDVMMGQYAISRPNSYIYVEGTFYTSTPAEGFADLSAPIRSFCAERGISAPAPDPSEPLPEDEQPRSSTPEQPGRMLDSLLKAATDKRRPVYPMRRRPMEGVTFRDLWLRVGNGAGNVYCHQGCCEHQLVFTDVRLIHETDAMSTLLYPLVVFRRQPKQRKCSICKTRNAVKVCLPLPVYHG